MPTQTKSEKPMYNHEPTRKLLEDIKAVIGDNVTTSLSAREHHSEDEAFHSALPDVVAFPGSTEEVAALLKVCNQHAYPVTAWGAGTSLEGNALASKGGLILDLSRMDQIVEIRAEDMLASVQPALRRRALNMELRNTGLFFPIDPGADATIGGMASTRASGTNAVRYGTLRDNVICLTVVLADGRIIKTASYALKSAAGYDLTALFVGSEGTLGIITEVTVKLHPIPEMLSASVLTFDELPSAVGAVMTSIQCGLPVARIELLDESMMSAVNKFEGADYPEKPTLFVEFTGSKGMISQQLSMFDDIVRTFGGTTVNTATSTEERNALWNARHNALYATKALKPGAKAMITDVCVPISRLSDCIMETRKALDESSLTATIAGHVGDGNFHTFILVDPDNESEIAEAERLHHSMALLAIDMGGTCTGEHGIGLGKKELLLREVGESVDVMRSVKAALDPVNILNPGKIFS